MPLPGGLNDEKEDINPPLPSDWTASSLKDVKLWNMHASPPCCKIRALLRYYNVPFQITDSKKPDSPYQKVPVLDLNGRQINDSYIIVKNLIPILAGKPLDERAVKMEEKITYETMISFEAEAFGTTENMRKLTHYAKMDAGFVGYFINLAVPLASWYFSSAIRKKHPNLPTPLACIQDFKEQCGGKPFFHGDEPGPIDVSLYGVLTPFTASGMEFALNALREGGLGEWQEKMKQKIPEV